MRVTMLRLTEAVNRHWSTSGAGLLRPLGRSTIARRSGDRTQHEVDMHATRSVAGVVLLIVSVTGSGRGDRAEPGHRRVSRRANHTAQAPRAARRSAARDAHLTLSARST